MESDQTNAGAWPNFSRSELRCKCGKEGCRSTGEEMDHDLMSKVQRVRDLINRGLPVSSAHRCPLHKDEQGKDKPGTHAKGKAIDLRVDRGTAHQVMHLAFALPYIDLLKQVLVAIAEEADIEAARERIDGLTAAAGMKENGTLPPAFTGIGVHQRNTGRFIHLDNAEEPDTEPRPTVWSY